MQQLIILLFTKDLYLVSGTEWQAKREVRQRYRRTDASRGRAGHCCGFL